MKKLFLILTLITLTVITTQAQVITDTDSVTLIQPLQNVFNLSKHTLKYTEQNTKDIQDINLRLEKFSKRFYTGLTVNLISSLVMLMGVGMYSGAEPPTYSSNGKIKTPSTERNVAGTVIVLGSIGTTIGGVIMLTAPAQVTKKKFADAYDK